MFAPPKRKLHILILVMIMISFVFFLILKDNMRIRKLVHISAGVDKRDNKGDLDKKLYLKQDSIKMDFEDLINDTIQIADEIIKIVSTELNDYNWNEEFQEEDLYSIYHETIFTRYFLSDSTSDRKFIVITFSNHVGNFCHAAAGRISLFEFENDRQNWYLDRSYLAFGFGNEYGLEPLGCELIRIGNNNKYAVIVHTSYSGQGHEKETKAVFAEVDESFELVFDFTSFEYYNDYPKDIEYTDGYSEMRILKSNKAWFDIETKREGTGWGDKTPGSVKHFVFDGEEYVENKDLSI